MYGKHSVEKFDLLIKVLSDLQDAGILKHLVLVGSWCQDFYRYQFGNPMEIPAAKTMDADILIPRNMPRVNPAVDIVEIMKGNDFVFEVSPNSGLYKFSHPMLKVEFLTDPGAKPDETARYFKSLGVTAQELHFMSLPLAYNYPLAYNHITINIPEPEAFALHKLIVSRRRINKEKAEKDRLAAQGMLLFFKGKRKHINRLHQILGELPRGWQKKIKEALEKTGLELPI
jgi:hypothetical protein